ncbi:MAG: MmgE/PrpD family protein [Rhodospirillales bacterium]
MTIARELARRIRAFRFADLPDDAIRWARTAILDTVGVALAGSGEDCVSILERTEGIGGAPGPCLVFGRAARTSALDATLINGTASHALDFDDVAPGIGGHPSVPLVPAIVALGEAEGASGEEALTAYVAGYETESRIGRAVNFHHYEKGWHPTPTLGVFGAVAASSRLLGLTEEQTATALGLAASLAAGIKANFGTMTKPLHIGHCGRSGMLAAMLAKEGFTADEGAFEHAHGFFAVFDGADNVDADKVFDGWADPLEVADPGPGLKQFPCCGSTHPSIACALELFRDEGFEPETVAGIEVLTNPRRLPHTDNPDPKTGLEAKFSIQYAVARALISGRVGFEHFEGDAFNDLAVRALMARVRVGPHPEMGAHSDQQFAAEVIVTTHDGRKLAARDDHKIGRGPADPMSRDELWAKFEDCAGRALPENRIRPLFETLERFETLKSMTALTDAIAIEAGAPPTRKKKVG